MVKVRVLKLEVFDELGRTVDDVPGLGNLLHLGHEGCEELVDCFEHR